MPNKSPSLIPIEQLEPHPDHPRLVEREDVVEQIEQQLRTSGYDPCYAITARPLNGLHQIVSGDHRVKAAQRAGLHQVPAWLREMDDEIAFFQLLLSNAQ